MTELKNEEIFRLIGFLKNIIDEEKLAEIEADLRT